MDKLLFKTSQDHSKDNLLMLSLEDRKVYVGKVISMGEPNELEGPDQEVTLLPLMSGYRRSSDLSVVFNTQYKDTEDVILVTIRQDSIISATKLSIKA